MQVDIKELSPAKLNIFLRILNKRSDGYHNIRSGLTLINLFDEVIARQNFKFEIKYVGNFAPVNGQYNDCIIKKFFKVLDIPKPKLSFTIKKNIPVQSGLGSASSNVAAIVRILKKLNYQDLNNKNFKKIGADIPFFLQNRDSLVRGIGEITINQTFPKYYFILAKPNEDCSTFDMYNSIDSNKLNYDLTSDTNQIEENDYGNDFEEIIKAKYYETKDLLKFMENLPNLIFTRLTGSGSCIFAAFNTKKNAEVAYQIFKKNYPDLWCMQVENNYK
tara:strand:- start:98 stop:922 length:825 start_codon:yes stop_codon:yes gene_type:complete